MSPSELMRQYVLELLTRHHAGTDGECFRLQLTLDGKDRLLVEEVETNRLWRISYLTPGPRRAPIVALEIQFFVVDDGQWIPFTIHQPPDGPKVYAELNLATSHFAVTDPKNQWALAAYCDAWTFYLREQGWLEKGVDS